MMKTLLYILIPCITWSSHTLTWPSKNTCDIYWQASKAPDMPNFKRFITLLFHSISTNDTLFLKNHILFPLKNSDFGAMIAPGKEKQLKSIGQVFFFQNLKIFFPSSLISDVKDEGEYGYNGRIPVPEYFITLLQTGDGDITVTYRWFFIKKSGIFYLTDFTLEAS